jgi:hypothetical protein
MDLLEGQLIPLAWQGVGSINELLELPWTMLQMIIKKVGEEDMQEAYKNLKGHLRL